MCNKAGYFMAFMWALLGVYAILAVHWIVSIPLFAISAYRALHSYRNPIDGYGIDYGKR